MKNISRRNIGGFTLVELLIVVLIIGILSAVALPMYQGAVDKSRFSTLLPAAKSIKDAQEAMRMSTGLYTDKMEDLDISMENGELNFTFDIHNSLADPSLFRTTSPKLENVRLASYFDFNPMMAGQKHCEAKAGDERANRLCGPIMQGQELGSTTDGYNRYLLDDDIDKATCDGISRTWSNKQGKCYKTEEDRCVANGMPYKDGVCGYNNQNNVTVEEGGSCIGTYNCQDSIFNPGSSCVTAAPSHTNCDRGTFDDATCIANEGSCDSGTFINGSVCEAVAGAHGCYGGTFSSGSQCIGNSTFTCHGATFNEGSKCIANAPSTCGALYNDVTYNGGCCEGQYCPDYAPKC